MLYTGMCEEDLEMVGLSFQMIENSLAGNIDPESGVLDGSKYFELLAQLLIPFESQTKPQLTTI